MRKACSSMRRMRCGITRTRSTGQRLPPECSSSSFSIRCCSGASAVDSIPPPLRDSSCWAASSACSSSEFSHRPGSSKRSASALS